MATTTNYSIYYPVASDSVAPLHTAFSTLATSVDTALTTSLKPLTDGQQANNYVVATVAAMNALTSVPVGSTCYVTATTEYSLYTYNGTAWVPIYKPWQNYTPTAITGFTFTTAEYMISGNRVFVNLKLTVTGTPSFTSLIVSNPLASRTILDVTNVIGSGIFKSGTSYFNVAALSESTTTTRLLYTKNTPAILANMVTAGNTNPAAFSTNSTVVVSYSYPLA